MTIYLFILFFIGLTKSAQAYIDPSTGSFLLQIILGLFFGGIVIFKMSWRKIKALFKKLLGAHGKRQPNEE